MKSIMADKRVKIVKVLIASPGDVVAERKIAQEVINEWNNQNAADRGVTLQAVLWESDAAPDFGDRVQGVLNKQIVDQCDFAIAVFWTRIGTDTGVAPGGAVEEIERMRNQNKLVMLYFSNARVDLKMLDVEQLTKLKQYKESLQKKALVTEYDELHEFRAKLLRQLDKQVRQWFCSIESGDVSQSVDSDSVRALLRYHLTLQKELGNINLSGSPAIESFSVRLKDTFVSLSLSATSRCETRLHAGDMQSEPEKEDRASTPERVMEFVFQHHPLLLVIGDPGSGKTTLLQYYALSCLDNGRHREFGFSEPVNVFYLPLRDLVKTEKGYASLPASLSLWAQKYFLEIDESLFREWLKEPSTLVLLDGLDEISDVHDRVAVCQWINYTVSGFANARFVVTSRSTGYRKGDGIELEASHLRADIMDFTGAQQAEFLHLWFRAAFLGELPPGSRDDAKWKSRQEQIALNKANAIIAYLAQDKNKSLRSLAGIPLLLQIMAMLWKDREYMPGSRVKLYDAALNYMLDYRDRRRGIYPLLAAEDARRVLSPVSLWMQEELKKDEVDSAEMQLKMQEMLDTLYNSLPADEFCRNLVDRAGVLVDYGSREYVFRHKSFREYLAGVQLVKNMHRPDYLDDLVTHFGDDWWQEVFRFFIGYVEDAELFDSFMQKLFDSPVTDSLTQKQQDLLVTLVEEAPQRKITALQKKLFDPKTTQNRQQYILECLKTIGKQAALDTVRTFTETGLKNVLLDKLGAEYILLQGGSFTFSLTKKSEVVPDLYVAKYTVTNRLYRQFINYLQSETVPESNARYKEKLQAMAKSIEGFSDFIQGKNDLAMLFRSESDDDKRFNKDDQPVMDISWYAAKAYCLWLSMLEGRTDDYYRLPTELEWEYAAAGKEGRKYPWGNAEPTAKLANYNKNEGATTPVGRYPEGATPEGLYDMAGNVWEWMENCYNNDKEIRALRGGSWYYITDYLRCVSRIFLIPAYRYFYIGFRVVRPGHSS
ncbi:MAG: SUMF1/EgtB/PvdO family nonheme iron enzyme [Chlorobiaceae bacterium]|nr:SUMF1/EgtB/PvdO family nonheme iron enzyme [Chlorobiaceae bacterium]